MHLKPEPPILIIYYKILINRKTNNVSLLLAAIELRNPQQQVFFLGATADNPYYSARYNGLRSDVNRIAAALNAGYDFTDWLNVSSLAVSRIRNSAVSSVSAARFGSFCRNR